MKKKQLETGPFVPAGIRLWRRDRKLPGSESCFADAGKREAGRPASPRGVAARHSLAARGGRPNTAAQSEVLEVEDQPGHELSVFLPLAEEVGADEVALYAPGDAGRQ